MFAASTVSNVAKGISEAKRGNTSLGYTLLEGALGESSPPNAKAWFGYCLASEGNNFAKARRLCMEALQQNPEDSDLYLALGRLYLIAGRRKPAIYTLEKGLKKERNKEIRNLLQSIGTRKNPVFAFLDRDNLINVTTGRLFARIGLR